MLSEDWMWSLIILSISVSILLKIPVQSFLKNFCTSNQLGNQDIDLYYVNNLKRKKIDSDSDEEESSDNDESDNKTLRCLHKQITKQCTPPSSPQKEGFQD